MSVEAPPIAPARGDDDPVVRAPRAMAAVADTGGGGVGLRSLLAIAGLGLLLGGSLGAVGLGIVHATAALPARGAPAAVAEVEAPPAARGPELFALVAPVDDGSFAQDADARTEETELPLGRGRTLAAAMHAVGVPRDETSRAVAALRRFVNMRSLMPADRVAAVRSVDGHALRRVELRRGPAQVWAAEPGDGAAWRGARVDLTPRSEVIRAGLRVQGSLAATLRAAGLRPAVVEPLAQAFAAVDLPPQLATGDVVRVLLEEERVAGRFQRYLRVVAVDYRGTWGHRRGYATSLGDGGWFDGSGLGWDRGPLRSPVPGAAMTSRFDPTRVHPVRRVPKPHLGVDWAAPEGTPVLAAAEGVVVSAGLAGPSGNRVRIAHSQLGVETDYCHLATIAPGLRPGVAVRARQVVGAIGSTGRSTGPHLHFAVRREGVFVDPASMQGTRPEVPPALRARFDAEVTQASDVLDTIAVAGEAPSATALATEPPTGLSETTPTEAVDDGVDDTDGAD